MLDIRLVPDFGTGRRLDNSGTGTIAVLSRHSLSLRSAFYGSIVNRLYLDGRR